MKIKVLKVNLLMASLCLLILQPVIPCQAIEQRNSNALCSARTTVIRSYNNNWQANIIKKHPNASQFYWTPMTVTTAKTVKNYVPSRSKYHNKKPLVVAWNSIPEREEREKNSSSKAKGYATGLQCTPTLTYSNNSASLYSYTAQPRLNSKVVKANIYTKEPK